MIWQTMRRLKRYWQRRVAAMQNFRHDYRFFRCFLSSRLLCFDVGANVGDRTRVFLSCGARVVAFEPQPACQQALRQRFGSNPRFTLRASALGATHGTAELLVGDNLSMGSMSPEWIAKVKEGRLSRRQWNHGMEVSVITLDAAIEAFGKPDFIKIDVEGYELAVLQGLSQPVSLIMFEFTPESIDQALSCVDRLLELGPYEFNYSFHAPLRFEDATWEQGRTFKLRLDSLRYERGNQNWGDVFARLAS